VCCAGWCRHGPAALAGGRGTRGRCGRRVSSGVRGAAVQVCGCRRCPTCRGTGVGCGGHLHQGTSHRGGMSGGLAAQCHEMAWSSLQVGWVGQRCRPQHVTARHATGRHSTPRRSTSQHAAASSMAPEMAAPKCHQYGSCGCHGWRPSPSVKEACAACCVLRGWMLGCGLTSLRPHE
jgi:hypothetical protein